MERVASNYLSNGDLENAAELYGSLEKLNPAKYGRMARICRVLLDPAQVPLPHRHTDICDALLDQRVPPQVLLRTSVEEVQRRFQRLAVCAHPDKNPNPLAKEAFLRLSQMRDSAIRLLQEAKPSEGTSSSSTTAAAATAAGARRREDGSGVAASSLGRSTTTATSGGGGGRPGKGKKLRRGRPGVEGGGSSSSGAGGMNGSSSSSSTTVPLAQLKATRITLSCLKRKDIDDDFEIFSAPQRGTAPRVLELDEVTPFSTAASSPLAATVPVPARGSRSQPGGRRQSSTPPPPPPSATAFTTTAAVPSAMEAGSDHAEWIPLPRLSTRGSSAVVEEQQADWNSNDAPRLVELACTSPKVVSSSVTTAGPVDNLSVGPSDCSSDVDAIRHQIDTICGDLSAMRSTTANFRFKLNLSYDAYQRGAMDTSDA